MLKKQNQKKSAAQAAATDDQITICLRTKGKLTQQIKQEVRNNQALAD